MNKSMVEVLAPAGSPEALLAAVRCGAAAIYLGGESFNARRAAHNFTTDQLRESVAYCHARGVAVHLTLNTLLRQDELDDAVAMAITAAECGVDAIIVQDLGLARRLRVVMPSMPLHASTQLSCHTPEGVIFLRDVGFRRVVLSREMTRDEIAACVGLGVEIEVFVHGALCMSVSGQCYFSAMLGSRSGNRGACAQPCRLPFTPSDGRQRTCPPDKAALSLKDNCLAAYVQDLAALGVTSLKIEGRMKRPEYVAAATAVYVAAARGENASPEAMEMLRKVFSRTGFTDGYYTDRRGGDMFGVRRKEDVTAASDVLKQLQRTYDKEVPLVPVSMHFTLDSVISRLSVSDKDGHTVTVTEQGGEVALNRPLNIDRATEQLQKTGGTPFYATTVDCTIEEGLTLPASSLNALRRQALEKLLRQREQTKTIPLFPQALPTATESVTAPIRGRLVRLSHHTQYSSALKADMVILPLSTSANFITRIAESGQIVGVEIPRGLFGTEEFTQIALSKAAAAGATTALCNNVGALSLAKQAGLLPLGGFGLNVTNREAIDFYSAMGLAATTLSMELTFDQMTPLLRSSVSTGLFVYGRQPLMLTRNCPRRCASGTCSDCKGQGLVDRTGTVFPLQCSGGCTELLNSVPLYWGDRLHELPQVDFHLFHFTDETPEQVIHVLHDYDNRIKPPPSITRGLYRRGVE